ncbi:MAG: glycerol-3-phosphate dehydrogenase [Rhodospirillales bacterium]|nr:glycerol-3-phosphate dehydrogenase [Rhodospirillales bacterium]
MAETQIYDLLVVGGGINGVGIARDAAGRGLGVLLCEQDDLANHTSSASSKLIHGGLRYLEHFDFRLVSKALMEREVLLRAAPHIIRPLRFVMPHVASLRPAWMIRIGLLLYDHLDFGKRTLLPGSSAVDLRRHPAGEPLVPDLRRGFVYSDAWVDDARLVILNAVDAAERGATIMTHTRCVTARREGHLWEAALQSTRDGDRFSVRARCLVNAAGPWVASFLSEALGRERHLNIRQVKGSHIVVRRLFEHDHAYIFQNIDRRIVFALPYEGAYTLIGTTDLDYDGDPAAVAISTEETSYLCDLANRYFVQEITPDDVLWSYSGVRPLVDDKASDVSAVTRDYVLDLDTAGAPVLSVFGGKITTYRKLAEEAVAKLASALTVDKPAWTGEGAPLPGGDIAGADFATFLSEFRRAYPWLPADLAERLARAYGTRAVRLLADAQAFDDLGEHLGDGLYTREVRYLVYVEWARTAEDILWRRSKLGLHVAPPTVKRLDDWMGAHVAAAVAGNHPLASP